MYITRGYIYLLQYSHVYIYFCHVINDISPVYVLLLVLHWETFCTFDDFGQFVKEYIRMWVFYL